MQRDSQTDAESFLGFLTVAITIALIAGFVGMFASTTLSGIISSDLATIVGLLWWSLLLGKHGSILRVMIPSLMLILITYVAFDVATSRISDEQLADIVNSAKAIHEGFERWDWLLSAACIASLVILLVMGARHDDEARAAWWSRIDRFRNAILAVGTIAFALSVIGLGAPGKYAGAVTLRKNVADALARESVELDKEDQRLNHDMAATKTLELRLARELGVFKAVNGPRMSVAEARQLTDAVRDDVVAQLDDGPQRLRSEDSTPISFQTHETKLETEVQTLGVDGVALNEDSGDSQKTLERALVAELLSAVTPSSLVLFATFPDAGSLLVSAGPVEAEKGYFLDSAVDACYQAGLLDRIEAWRSNGVNIHAHLRAVLATHAGALLRTSLQALLRQLGVNAGAAQSIITAEELKINHPKEYEARYVQPQIESQNKEKADMERMEFRSEPHPI